MEDKLRNHNLVGLSYSICSQGDRLTGAFNYYYPLPEGPILKKISNISESQRKCQPSLLGHDLHKQGFSFKRNWRGDLSSSAQEGLSALVPD